MADDTDLSFFLCGFYGFGTAGYAAVGHVDGFYCVVLLEGSKDFFVGELVVVVGFYNLDLVAGEAYFRHAGSETVQTGPVAVKLQVACRGQDLAGGGDAFADEFCGDSAAFVVVLPDEAEPVCAGKVAVEGDDRNVVFGKGPDFLFYRGVVHGTDGSPLYTFLQQSVQFFDAFFGNVGLTFFYQDFYVEICKFCLGGFNSAHDFPAEMACPVGQKHTQLDWRETLAEQGFLIGASGGEVACLLNGGHDSVIYIGTYVGAVVENAVNGSAGYSRFVGDHLYGWFFVYHVSSYMGACYCTELAFALYKVL